VYQAVDVQRTLETRDITMAELRAIVATVILTFLAGSLAAEPSAVSATGSDTAGSDRVLQKASAADSSSAESQSAEVPSVPSDLGRLRVTSVPDSALVVLDSADRGKAPIVIDSIAPGEHELQVKKKGYYIKKAKIVVEAGKLQEVSVELTKPCRLVVTSQPAGAMVFLNQQKMGVTPFVSEKVAPGEYELKVGGPSLEYSTQTLTLANGAADSVFVTLKPAKAGQESPAPQSSATAKPKSTVMAIVSLSLFVVFSLIVLVVELSK
jgi:hypothetical protein